MITKGIATIFVMLSAFTALLTMYGEEVDFDFKAAFISILGWLLYNVLMWSLHKDPVDQKGKKFNYKAYVAERADNIVLSAVVATIVAYLGPQINALNYTFPGSDVRSGDLVYLSTGALVQYFRRIAKNWK